MARHFLVLGLACVTACTSGTTVLPDAHFDEVDGGIHHVDAGPVDGGPSCGTGMMFCGGGCIDVTSDDSNCGDCGMTCPARTHCAGASCSCPEPRTVCDGVCSDTQTDALNCGRCGMPCPPGQMCTLGGCIDSCDAPLMTCLVPATDAPDGGTAVMPVCTDLQTDTMNCGRCNVHCRAGLCEGGHCVCPAGLSPCSGMCFDLQHDVDHCGSCIDTCGTGGTCDTGVCTACGPDRTLCGMRCADTMTDRRNCGDCGITCAGAQTCVSGACTCAAPLLACGALCTDPMTDPENCGDCGISCGPGGLCSAGACTCATGLMLCSGSCRNVRNDRNNCGSCDMMCGTGEVCSASACTSAPPIRYTMETPTTAEVPWIEACTATGHMTILSDVDDDSTTVSLPFPFRYWAVDLPMGSSINVCSNGWLSMAGGTDTDLGGTVPSTDPPDAVIAPHWRDLETRTAGVCVATVGTAPNRQFVIEWADVYNCCFSSSAHDTFEVVLNEASGVIDIAYDRMMMADFGVMGIEDQTGANGFNACPGAAADCIPTTGERVQFIPSL